MSAELTYHTGNDGESLRINVEWFDHNGRRLQDVVDIVILPQDKPRTLEIRVGPREPDPPTGYGPEPTPLPVYRRTHQDASYPVRNP